MHDVVSEPAAVALAGASPHLLPGDAVTYVVGPTTTVIIVEAGDRPDGSGVESFDEIVVRGPFPHAVVEMLSPEPDNEPTILGFVRLAEGCLSLGSLRVSSANFVVTTTSPRSEVLEECRLQIDDPLPFEILDRVRPTSVPNVPDLGWIGLLPDDPIGALAEFMADWFADVPPSVGGCAPARFPLPAPLTALYRVAGGRQELLGRFNRIYAADAIYADDTGQAGNGLVVFGTECQGSWDLLLDPTEADPRVIYVGLADHPVVERERLSGFLMQFALSDAAVASPYGGWASVHPEEVRSLVEQLQPVPMRPMRWPADPTNFYVGPGLVVAICPAGGATAEDGQDTVEVYVGSRWRAALRTLREPGFRWEHFTG